MQEAFRSRKQSQYLLCFEYKVAKEMKKNGTTPILQQVPGHLDTKIQLPELKNNDEDDLPSTEEVEEGDSIDEGDLLETVFTDSVKEELNRKYDSIEKLIIVLKLHQDPRTDKLADTLSDLNITGTISPKSLFNTLLEIIIKCMKPLKIKKGEDKEDKLLQQSDLLKFYLTIFNFTPNTMVKEKQHKKLGLNILMIACENTQNSYLPDLLIYGLSADIHESSQDGRRLLPLHFACELGNLYAVKCLVEAGADINQGKFTPLGIALNEREHDIVHFLLLHDTIDASKLSDGVDPYLLAAQHATARNFITIMLKKNVNPNMLTSCSESALSIALSRTEKGVQDKERDDIVRILLKSSVFSLDINLPSNGESPLFIAARLDNLFALNLLLEKGANCHFVATRGPYKGHSVLSIAVYEGNHSIVKRLTEICKLDFIKPFFIDHSRLSYTLLSLTFANAKSNKDNKKNHELTYSQLQSKWIETHPDQVRAYIKKVIKNNDITELLQWKKFILSRKSISPETGNTPLHIAASLGKVKSIQCLFIDIGVPHDSQNLQGETPLHLACRKKQAAAVSQLLILGASPELKNNEAQTPYLLAKQLKFETCIRAFIKYNYDMGYEIPSIESARADNDELLAKIIGEFLAPPVETPPLQVATEAAPIKPRKKNKPKKNQRRTLFFAAISEREPHTSPNHHSSQHKSNGSLDLKEGDITSTPSPEIILMEHSPTLPVSPESPLKFRSYFSHTSGSNTSAKNPTISPSIKEYPDFTLYLFSEIKDRIEDQFRFIANNQPDIMVKASLQALIDYYSSINYLAVIGLISEESPILRFIQALRSESLLKGLDLNINVSYWSLKAIEVYKLMLSEEKVFHLDNQPATFEISRFG